MGLKRCPVSSGGSPSSVGPSEKCKLAERFPTFWEFLSLSTWEDGASRVTGTITLMWEGGTFKAALNDRDASTSAFVSGRTLTALLEALEKGLVSESLEWRVKRDDRPRGGSRNR